MSSKVYNDQHAYNVENSIMNKLNISNQSISHIRASRMLRKTELKNLSETIERSGETFELINSTDEVSETEMTQESSKYVFYPEGKFVIFWEIVCVLLCVHQAITIPYRVCFSVITVGLWGIADIIIDCLFIFDVMLNFNIGFYSAGNIVLNRKLIAMNYLKSWFLLDFISSLPYALFISPSIYFDFTSNEDLISKMDLEEVLNHSSATHTTVLLIRLMKLLRLLKLIRLIRISKELEGHVAGSWINKVVLSKLLFLILFILHWGSCIWYLIGINSYDDEGESWLTGPSFYLIDNTDWEKYIASIYHFSTTMTTVGYGDIVPTNNDEKVFCIFTMVLASCLYAYFIGTIATLLSHSRKTIIYYEIKLATTLKFLRERRIDDALVSRIRNYISYRIDKMRKQVNERDILDYLSKDLSKEVHNALNKNYLVMFEFFNTHEEFCGFLASRMREVQFSPSEIIFDKYDASDAMYFISKGQINMFDQMIVYKKLSKMDHFGEIGFFTKAARILGAESQYFSILMKVTKEDIKAAITDYDQNYSKRCLTLLNEIEHLKVNLINKSLSSATCYACNKNGHYVTDCNEVNQDNVDVRYNPETVQSMNSSTKLVKELMKKHKDQKPKGEYLANRVDPVYIKTVDELNLFSNRNSLMDDEFIVNNSDTSFKVEDLSKSLMNDSSISDYNESISLRNRKISNNFKRRTSNNSII